MTIGQQLLVGHAMFLLDMAEESEPVLLDQDFEWFGDVAVPAAALSETEQVSRGMDDYFYQGENAGRM